MTTTTSRFQEVSLPQGIVRYYEQGTGPTLVFIHGLFANHSLWQDVMTSLAPRFHCIAPDLPLGSHMLPMRPDADITPPGVAQLIADFLAALDLQDVTLVGNDTGGAMCQLTIAHHPERITRLVLTNCDAYEQFFPTSIRLFQYAAQFFGRGFTNFLALVLRNRSFQRAFVRGVSLRTLDDATLDAFFTPFLQNSGVRRDITKFLRAVSSRYTLEAACTFPQFQHPVLLVWGNDDIFFPNTLAKRLQQAFPDAELIFVNHSRAFVPFDQPLFLAERITEFVHEPIIS